MKHLTIHRVNSLHLYARANSPNYSSSCQVMLDGDHGIVHTLNGRDFYQLLSEEGLRPFHEMGLQVITASMSAAHCRLVERALRGVAAIDDVGTSRVQGHELRRVEIATLGYGEGKER